MEHTLSSAEGAVLTGEQSAVQNAAAPSSKLKLERSGKPTLLNAAGTPRLVA